MTKIKNSDVSQKCWDEWISKKAVANSGIAVVNYQRQVLILYKQKYGEWELPSGGIDRDETPKDAALREVKEETGILLRAEQLVEIKTVTAFHQNDKTDIVTTFMAYPIANKHIEMSQEHTKYQWLPLQNYNKESVKMHEATREQLKAVYDFLFSRDSKYTSEG